MDDSIDISVYDVEHSSDFEPAPKTKPKAPAKKAAAVKPKAAKPAAAPKAKTAPKPKKRAKPSSDEENSDGDDDAAHDDSLLSNTPPSKKKQKITQTKPKKSGAPLAELQNESYALEQDTKVGASQKTSATDQYQKLTQLEHILKRPDTYIGSVEATDQHMWVYNSETQAMEFRKVSYVPGLYKIFDEILVNAADNRQRDKNMSELRVWVNREEGFIAVRNNGRGIPIEIHEKEKLYIPEMIFGHLLTSSNYDDNEAKVTGGRNGYGAKLTNIYSTKFELDTVDSKTKQRYRQVWSKNMSVMGDAKIATSKVDDYTMITFYPDFAKFGMSSMDDDFEALVKRRVYDMAGTVNGVKVYLNDERIKIAKFKQYMEMYTKAIKTENIADNGQAPEQVILTDNPHERWEIGFAVSDGSFQQVSFVNSIATTQGGSHVNFIADQVVDKLEEIVLKKNKGGVKLKKAQIKNHIFLFVNCQVVNPAFTSQTKEQLTTKPSAFGSKPQVSDKFLKAIANTEAVNNIIHFAKQKADKVLAKSDGNRRQRMDNAKLTDANKAGTKDGHMCTLILTEGDSASLLALAGRAVVNPDLFGVFPLRGKLLNVRDATIDQISKNEEIQNIKKFMGLQHKKEYTDTKSLRYGHLMIMTDQDHDGSHIKGLLINFLQVQFPSLLKLDGFLLEFITPIVKTWKGDPKHPTASFDFFTMPEYEAWKLEPGHSKGWEHKYYKGLGTSNTTDAKIYFSDLDRHLKEFHTMQDGEPELIDLAFSKKKADARKGWLQNFVPGTYLDMGGMDKITYDDFINKELILFSMADNQRSIPSIIDGFKPGQRKVLYTCFKRNIKKDLKVVSLAGAVSEMTAYPYGEASLQQTIVGLAQNFVGSNNINCLEPSGNFGSRLQGGQDAASPRYIYTRLSPFARRIFHQSDEALLTYNTDDGNTIEPEHYLPIVPMILINGADGIGTGWSTSIPNYNPEEVIENLKLRMHAESKDDMKPMKPWFRGWTGEAEDAGNDRYKFTGKVTETGDCEVEITELPVRVWTQEFKNKLEEIIRADKMPSFIKDYVEYNTPETIHFVIKLVDGKKYDCSDTRAMEELFKLSRTLATSNLVAFDAQGRIHKYATVLDIMEEFYHVRLHAYQKRKQFMLGDMQRELEKLSNQARFIQMIIDNKLIVSKKKKAVLVAELNKLGFTRFPKVLNAKKSGEIEELAEEADEIDVDEDAGANDFDYLLGMAIWSLTQERVEKLLRQIGDKEEEIDALTKKTPKDLWTTDLDELLEEWRKQLAEEATREKKVRSKGRRASAKLGIAAKAGKKRKGADGDDDDDAEFTVKRAKSAKTAPKSAMAGLLALKSESKPPGVYPVVNGIEQKPVVRPLAEQIGDIAMTTDSKPQPAKAAPPKATAVKPAKKAVKKSEDDSEEDVFAAVAAETAKQKPVARSGRAAAQKLKTYKLADESDIESTDDGADLFEDVASMVKGVGPDAGAGERVTRFFHPTSTQRPSSSHSVLSKPKKSALTEISEGETDWNALAQSSPQKTIRHTTLPEEESDSELQVVTKPATKAKAAAKSSEMLKPKKAPAARSVVKTLSPAAKAYASMQTKAAASKSTAEDQSFGLDDDNGDIVSKPVARPAKRQAATKSKYVASDDEDESEFVFGDDD